MAQGRLNVKKEQDAMWSWIYEQALQCCTKKGINPSFVGYHIDGEDIANDVILFLIENPKKAEEIFEAKNVSQLSKIVSNTIFTLTSKERYRSQKENFIAQRVRKTCDEKGIMPIPENAYKIAGVIDKNGDFSIATIERLLRSSDLYGIGTMSREEYREDTIIVDIQGEVLDR